MTTAIEELCRNAERHGQETVSIREVREAVWKDQMAPMNRGNGAPSAAHFDYLDN